MANYIAPQFGVKYVLTNPNGARVTFNDVTDADNVGALTNITGLDSPDVRENGDNLVEFDGGIHGNFYYGRRPLVFEGLIYGHVSNSQRNERVARLMDVTNAMRNDMTITWTPSGGSEVFVNVRRQQPVRISGGWNKTFQLSMVSADPRLYSTTLHTTSATSTSGSPPSAALNASNIGNTDTFPYYTVWGPMDGDTSVRHYTDRAWTLNASLAVQDIVYIDMLNRTVLLGQRAAPLRQNLYPNPSFENGSTSFLSAPSGCNATYVAPFAQPTPGSGYGSNVMKLTTAATGATISYIQLLNSAGTTKFPAGLSGGTYYLTVASRHARAAAAPAYKYAVKIDWYTAAGAFVSTTTDNAYGTLGTSFVYEAGNYPAPATATQAEVFIGVSNAPSAIVTGNIYYFDTVLVEPGPSAGVWFDVASSSNTTWVGAANASATYQVATVDSGAAPVQAYHLIDFPNTSWTGLQPGLTIPVTVEFPFGGTGFPIVSGVPPVGHVDVAWRDAWI